MQPVQTVRGEGGVSVFVHTLPHQPIIYKDKGIYKQVMS